MQEKPIGTAIVLTVITCGIYGLFWLFEIGTTIRDHLGAHDVNPATDLILSILCFPYSWYVMFKYPQKVYELGQEYNPRLQDQSALCLIMAVLGLGIVSLVVIQSELNKLAQA